MSKALGLRLELIDHGSQLLAIRSLAIVKRLGLGD
jgi:hypothetical protein